eukprot:COSAG02_NODE_521_length_20750_cov_10.721079_1_plen_137_part_00
MLFPGYRPLSQPSSTLTYLYPFLANPLVMSALVLARTNASVTWLPIGAAYQELQPSAGFTKPLSSAQELRSAVASSAAPTAAPLIRRICITATFRDAAATVPNCIGAAPYDTIRTREPSNVPRAPDHKHEAVNNWA